MTNSQIEKFCVLVVGENPDDIMGKFDDMLELPEPYILYHYKDKHHFRKTKIDAYKAFIKNIDDEKIRNVAIDKMKELKEMSDEQYYMSLGELHSFDINKNIITNENPNGRWLTCEKGGKSYSEMLVDLNGKTSFSDNKNNINWSKLHLNSEIVKTYTRAWEICVDKVKQETATDINIFNNMKPHMHLFDNFKTKGDYVKYNSSFFTNAVVFNGEWYDMEGEDYAEWIINYYDSFINKLKGNELITIYECTK